MDPNNYAYTFKIEQLQKQIIQLQDENEKLKNKVKELEGDSIN